MSGVFALWQPRYAEHGIATFPVREKKPAVQHYLKIGSRASEEFAMRFADDDAFGLACRRNKLTILDVDAPDERLLADAMNQFGPTPFVVRSGSGNFQAWYRNNGEKRKVRPDPRRPIDILGDGFVVAPPSRAAKGEYSIICGTLADLASLPTMRRAEIATPANDETAELVEVGQRNVTLWRHCMQSARRCGNISNLMEEAVGFNTTQFYEPLPADEVLNIVANAWSKETEGTNWFGRGGRVVFDTAEVDDLMQADPDAFLLLTRLRRHHWNREFVVANGMAETMPGNGWTRKRFAAARLRLATVGIIEEVRAASRHNGAAVFRFKGGRI